MKKDQNKKQKKHRVQQQQLQELTSDKQKEKSTTKVNTKSITQSIDNTKSTKLNNKLKETINQLPESSCKSIQLTNESFLKPTSNTLKRAFSSLSENDQEQRTSKDTSHLLEFFQDKQINILELANSFGLNVDKQTDCTVDNSSLIINSNKNTKLIDNKMGKKKNQKQQQEQQTKVQELNSNIQDHCIHSRANENETNQLTIDHQQETQQSNLFATELEDIDFENDFYNSQSPGDSEEEDDDDDEEEEEEEDDDDDDDDEEDEEEEDESLAQFLLSSKAQFLLSSKSDIKQRDLKDLKELTHSLLEASASGHADIVQLLLQYNAKVDVRTRQGNTCLIYAASHGHTNVVRVLMKHVQDKFRQDNKNISPEQFIEIYNDNGHTALMECIGANHLECAKVLINEFNASVTCQSNEYKESCLTLACYKGHYEIVKFLLELNNNQHHYSTEELTNALLETSLDGHVDIARLLIDKGAQVNMPEDSNFESCLNLAACGNHIELACLLLSKNANIEEINDEGYTPLQSSVREKHEEMVALLLSKNANINYVTKETQETALGLACASNFFEIADFLIRAGANLELGNQTPLQISCQEGHIELVKHLIECGANVNARSLISGDTCLHYAIDYPEIVRLLILSNADIEAENDLGLTCLQKAIQTGKLNTIQVLVECGANIKNLETSPTTSIMPSNNKKLLKSKNNSQNKISQSTLKEIDPIHQKIHEQHMMLVNSQAINGENQQQQLHLTSSEDNFNQQPILCEKHASECTNAKRKLSQQHYMSEDNDRDLFESQAFEQLTNYFQKQRNESNPLTAISNKKKARLKQQLINANCSSQSNENICNELLSYELLSSKKLKSAMKSQPDRCIKLIDELMCKLNNENRLTSNDNNNENLTSSSSSPTSKVSSLPISPNHKLNALKETERLEQCINHMMRRTELLNPSKEEQIKQKQQILEELQRVEKELQEKAQLTLSHHNHQKEKFLKSLCAQSQQHKQQLASIKNQPNLSNNNTTSNNNQIETSTTDAKLDSMSFSFKKGLSKLISFNKDTPNCLLDNATNSATDHPSDSADSSTLLSNMECFDKELSDEEFLESLQQPQAILDSSNDPKLKISKKAKLKNLLTTNCNLKGEDLNNKILNSLSSDCSNQSSNDYQMVTLPKIAEEIKRMQTHLSNEQNQDSNNNGNNQKNQNKDDLNQQLDESETNTSTSAVGVQSTSTTLNTDDELSALFDTFEDGQIKLFKELSKKLNIDNPLLAKILYEFPSTSDCSEQDNQAIIIEETEDEDDCLDEEQSDDDENLTDQDEFFVEEDQLTGDHHIVHERRVLNLKQYPNIEEMFKDNHKQLFTSSDEDDEQHHHHHQLTSCTHHLQSNEKYLCDRSTQTIFSSSPNGVFQLLKKPMCNDKMSYIKKKPPIVKTSNQIKMQNVSTQTNSVGKCVSVSESFVRKKSVNISSRDHVTTTCDHSRELLDENLTTIESLCNNLNSNSINNLCNESKNKNSNSSHKNSSTSCSSTTKNSFTDLSKEDADSRKLFDQIMKFNKLKSESPENKDIKKMINQWVLEVSKNSHLLNKLERITSYPKETISEMVLTAKKDSSNQQSIHSSPSSTTTATISSTTQNKENNNNNNNNNATATSSSTTVNETSLLLVENETKGNLKLSNKQSAKLAKKLIKSTIKKELKNTKILNSNNDLNKSSIKIQSSATINNSHTNSSNQQALRNHVRNIMKAKRTLNQTTITEEHHTQVTISSRSKDNCSKIDLKLLEEALPPDEYNQILNQINYNYSCFNKNDKKGSGNNCSKTIHNTSTSSCDNKTTTTTTTISQSTNTNISNKTTCNKNNKNTSNKSTKSQTTSSRNSKQNNTDNEGKSHDTALTQACAHGHFELVKLLVARGAKIDHRDPKGFTPLHWSAMNGHLEIIDFLINNNNDNNKVDLEAEDKLSMTPLLVAAWYGHLQVVQKLIGYGSSVSKIDKRGQSIIHCASKGGHVDIVKYLLNNCLSQLNLDAQDGRKLQTALHLAVINSNFEIVNRLLECGASIKIKDKSERTVVHWSATKGNSELLERFLQDKDNIEINARDIEGKSALLLACEFGHKKCAQLLLKSGSDIYSTDNEGRTSLHLAVMNNHHNIVQILVQKGASLNVMNGVCSDLNSLVDFAKNPDKFLSNKKLQRQQVPLHIACEMGFTESAQILLSHGADYTIVEKATGKTPLLIAAFGGHVEIGRLLVCKYNADMNAQLVQVNPKNSENIGYTALAICAEKGYCEFVELLINNKANLEIKTKKGCTPLWLSCSFGQLEVVQLLVNAGADVDAQDNRKITCIMAAFRSGNIRVIRWLVKFITQFPSDNEMLRYISICSEEEKKRCKICMDIINEEKSKQAAQANDIAQTLLEELSIEKMEEEAKKMGKKLAATKKRERKKQKRKESKIEEEASKAENEKVKNKQQSNKSKTEMVDKQKEKQQETESKIETSTEVVEQHSTAKQQDKKNTSKNNKQQDKKTAILENKDLSKKDAHSIKEIKDKEEQQINIKNQKSVPTSNNTKQQQQAKDKKKKEPETNNTKNKVTVEKTSKKSTNKSNNNEESIGVSSSSVVEKNLSIGSKNLNLPSNTSKVKTSPTSSTSSTSNVKQQQQKEDDWKEVVRRQKKINLPASNSHQPPSQTSNELCNDLSSSANFTHWPSTEPDDLQKKITVPANAISRVIGRGGCNIKLVREVSGANIDIEKKITVPASNPHQSSCQISNIENQQQKTVHQGDRHIVIKGSNEATKNAYQLIQSLVNEPEKDISQILNQLGLSKATSTASNEISSAKLSSVTLTSTNNSTSVKQSTNVIARSSNIDKASQPINAKDHQKYTQINEAAMLYKSNNSSINNSRKNSNTNYQHTTNVTEHDEPISSSSQRSASIWNAGNLDKQRDNLSRSSNNRAELLITTSNESKNQHHNTTQKETGYFSPFDSILGKVAQETIWQSTKEQVKHNCKPNFASVVASAGTNSNNSSSSMNNNYLANSDNSLNKSFKKVKEPQIDLSKAPGYRPVNILSPNHATSSSYQQHQQQQLGTSVNSSNLLNQIMINSFGPIGAKSAPCTPPLSTSSASMNKPLFQQSTAFSTSRKDHFNSNNNNNSNPNVQKLLINSPNKSFNTSNNHNFITGNQYSTSSSSLYQNKNYLSSSNYPPTGNRALQSSTNSDSASSLVINNLLQSTSNDLPSSNEPLFSGSNNTSSMQMNTNYQTQLSNHMQMTPSSSQQSQATTTTQPLASNLQIQMRAALLAAGAQLQQCMNPQLSGQQNNKTQQLQQLFQQAATRFQQLNNLNQTDLSNQPNENKLRLQQQMQQQYNMSFMRSNSQQSQNSSPASFQSQQQPQTNPTNRLLNSTIATNPIQKIQQSLSQPSQSLANTLNLNTSKLSGFSPNSNKFNIPTQSTSQQPLNQIQNLSNQFQTTANQLQINNPQILTNSQLFANASKLQTDQSQSFNVNEPTSSSTTTLEEKRLPRPIGTERAQRVKLLPEQQTFNDFNDLSSSANFTHWSSTEPDDWSTPNINSVSLNSPNQFNSPNATAQLLNYDSTLFNGSKNPLIADTDNYWSNLNASTSSIDNTSTQTNANLSNLTTLTKMSSWQSDWTKK